MNTREIPAADWRPFLEQFSRDHRAWLATIERIAGASRQIDVVERPLGSVVPQLAGGRVVGIVIRFQEDSATTPGIHVESPMVLRVDETAAGSAHTLEIESGSGERTRILFRASPPLEALDGVAPGEV